MDIDKFRVKPGDKLKLSGINPDFGGNIDKDDLKDATRQNIKQMVEWQQRLYAEGKQSLLVVFQAMDAAGKDSTIRRVFGALNPQGCSVASFKAPTAEELSHDILWRIHQKTPAKGMIRIFNRSHYEDVIVVRVHDWIDDAECERRYGYFTQFEDMLRAQGTRILKFFLYISKDEQKSRFQDRLDEKEKNWKFSFGDLEERKLWDKYMAQFEEVISHTSTNAAPWYVIPANHKSYRDMLISSIVRRTFEDMNPNFPKPEEGIENVVIE